MIERAIKSELLQSAKEYPVVTIIGPRQAGKTTLAKMTFPNHQYVTLEDPAKRQLAQEDPQAFFSQITGKTIIDEIQRVPQLLSYIQVIVDEHKINGEFILTGSHQLELRESVTQSLAGRTAMLKLLPLSLAELKDLSPANTFEQIYKGFLPRIYDENQDPTRAYRNYYDTYVQRDVTQLINIKNQNSFQRFMKLLAGRVGQIVNYNSLASDVGVSSNTIKEWLSILEASFIVFQLNPYFENFGKRVIKSPKVYFTDTGLLCYLLGIENAKQLERDPLIGNIFENLVILEAFKWRYNNGKNPNLYYFRTSQGNEVDLIYQKGRELIPIEIKSSMTFNKQFLKGINFFQESSKSTTRAYVVYNGSNEYDSEKYFLINFRHLSKIFE